MLEDLGKIIAIFFIAALFGIILLFANSSIALAAGTITPAQKLIKTANNHAVYSVLDGEKNLMPNEYVFNSHGYKWSDIKTVSEKELNSYHNVKSVKLVNDDTVYYINFNKKIKKAYLNAEIFLDYGNKWEDIRIISEKNLDAYKNADLIKTQNDSAVYIIEKNARRLVPSSEIFTNLGYKWEDILEVSKKDLEGYVLAEPVSDLKITTNNPVLNLSENSISKNEEHGLLNVSLSNDSPKDTVIPTGSTGEFTKITLTSAKGETKITRLIIAFLGVSSNEDVSSVYLIDTANNYFTYKTTPYNKKAEFFFSEPIILAEGESKTLTIKASITNNADAQYRTIGFGINEASDIKTDSLISSSFPISGTVKQMINGSKILGFGKITAIPLNYHEINQGAKDQTLAAFKIEETSKNEDILLTKIGFKARGNILYSDLINLDLIDDNNKILGTSVWMQKDGTVLFNLNYNPLKIKKSSSRAIALRADIAGKGNKEFEFIIPDSSFVITKGANSQVEINSAIISSATQFVNKLSLKKAALFIYLDENSTKETVAGAENKSLALFKIRGINADISLKTMSLSFEYAGTPLEGDVKIINSYSGEVLFTLDAGILAKEKKMDLYFTPEINIKAQQVLTLNITGNIKNAAAANTTYLFTLDKFGFKDLQSDIYDIKFETVRSNIVTIKNSALYIDPLYTSSYYIAGAKDINLASFKIIANQSEDMYIKSLSLKPKEGYDAVDPTNGFYNIRLNLGNTSVSYALNIPSVFTFNKPYKIPAGTSLTIKLYADTYPTAEGTLTNLVISNIDAFGGNSYAKPFVEGLQTSGNEVQIKKLGFNIEKNNNFNGGEVKPVNNAKIGSFKLSAKEDNVKITQLTLATSDDSNRISYLNGFKNLKLVSGGKTLGKIENPFPEFNIFNTNLTINNGEDLIVDIYVDIPNNCDCDGKKLEIAIKAVSGYGVISKVSVAPEDGIVISNGVMVNCDCE